MEHCAQPAGTMPATAWERVWARPRNGLAAWLCAFGNWVSRLVTFSMLRDVNLKGGTILDLGCGHADMTMTILRRHGGRALTAVDFCSEAIESVRRRKGTLPVTTIQADLLALDLDQQFDLVYSSLVIEHFWGEARWQAMAQHVRFAKPGGYVFITTPGRSLFSRVFDFLLNRPTGIHEEHFTSGELRGLLSSHGLEIIRFRDLLFQSVLFVLARKQG
ncbi:MAG: class I SAM-dependent methyltransferase [Anaerolineae bacterium]|nr:class I SAM-dependent methyltransferase [Anaerolineae bacterium]MDH7473731.1 class I SAM-dependent methyltransferase [Anaerolineae bacterium]